VALAPLPPPIGAEPAGSSRGPLVVVAFAVAVLVLLVGLVIAVLVFTGSPTSSQPRVLVSAAPGTDPGVGDTSFGGQGQLVSTVECNSREQLVRHQHAHLFILKDGVPQPVAAYIGIPGAPYAAHCFYWLHTHDRSGIIHIEAPSGRPFSLGQFFDVWGQPLTSRRVARIAVPDDRLTVFVDGSRYTGDPRRVELKAHTQVVIEIGREVAPPGYDLSGY
jgi:hypothetical protein